MPLDDALSNGLAQHRKAEGLTLQALAEILGLRHAASLSAIETGAEKPSLELALRIQVWSKGAVPAARLRPDLAQLIEEAGRALAAQAQSA